MRLLLLPLSLSLALAAAAVSAQDVPRVPTPVPTAQPQAAEDAEGRADDGAEDPADPDAGAAAAAEASTIPLQEIQRYVSVYNAVREAYVDPVEDRALMQSAIRGLLLDLDPHSAYLERNDAKTLDEQTRGAYDGIGVELLRQPDNTLLIIAPIDDTPAARAGIKPGDLIIAIDGKPIDLSDEQAEPLRGPPGSVVELTIKREGSEQPLVIPVTRQTIRVASVRGRMLEPGYGYLRISTFQADTAADFVRVVERLKSEAGGRLKGLVLDLRSNPGGLLVTAVQVADELLQRGTIVSTRGRIAVSDATFSATPGDRLDGAPVVVLVDVGSASAAEVLAGALADHGRARVVGSRTFGKGSVQTVLTLDNGDSVKLTTARYYTPSGKSIQALGIVPQVVLHPDEGSSQRRRSRITEAALPGHLRGDGEVAGQAGEVLEGQEPIDAALEELKQPGARAAKDAAKAAARPPEVEPPTVVPAAAADGADQTAEKDAAEKPAVEKPGLRTAPDQPVQ